LQESIRNAAALGVSRQPERLDVLRSNLLIDEFDDLLQVPIVVLWTPLSIHGRRRGDHETIPVLEIHERQVMAMPVAEHTSPVETQYQQHGLVRLEIARVIEKESAIALWEDSVPMVCKQWLRAISVRTVKRWRRHTRRSVDPHRLRVWDRIHQHQHETDRRQ
jgi:hypothetical protein